MTEAEWLKCNDPKLMLDFLRGEASERKMRLLGAAICHQFQEQLDIAAIADALEAVARYADTRKTKAALKRARQGVKTVRHGIPSNDKARVVEWAALWLVEVAASENAFGGVGDEMIRLASLGWIGPDKPTSLVKLIHHIFGPLPFRPILGNSFSSTPAVIRLARTIYDARVFQRMPELADALERAGCKDADILAHCRSDGPHVPGCWVVDFLLGKE